MNTSQIHFASCNQSLIDIEMNFKNYKKKLLVCNSFGFNNKFPVLKNSSTNLETKMKLSRILNEKGQRIRIKTYSHSKGKQNLVEKQKNSWMVDGSQKLKLLQTSKNKTNASDSHQINLSRSKRPSANSKQVNLKKSHPLLVLQTIGKQQKQSNTSLIIQKGPSIKQSSRKSILNLFINQKEKSSIEKVQVQNIINNHSLDDFNKEQISQNQANFVKYSDNLNLPETKNFYNILPPIKKMMIEHQFTLFLNGSQNFLSKEASTQTFYQGIDDQFFFEEYVKYKTSKKDYEILLSRKQQRISHFIASNIRFQHDYQYLIDSINTPPSNPRQQRVFCLAKDLQKTENDIHESLNRIKHFDEEWAKIIGPESNLFYKKKNEILSSIKNLSQVLQNKLQNLFKQTKNDHSKRILSRIVKQLYYLEEMNQKNRKSLQKGYKVYYQQVLRFQFLFKQWTKILYQNRVLLFNFMRQIQKIPLAMTEMFGFLQDQHDINSRELDPRKSSISQIGNNCDDCYPLKKNIKQLQFFNSQFKSVFKVLECLIRDGNKKRQSLLLI